MGFLNGMDNLLVLSTRSPAATSPTGLAPRALLVFNLISMAGFIIVIFVQHWLAVILVARVVPVMDGHLAAGDNEPGRPRVTQEQTDDGRVSPFFGTKGADGLDR